jgi:hypothetical protein
LVYEPIMGMGICRWILARGSVLVIATKSLGSWDTFVKLIFKQNFSRLTVHSSRQVFCLHEIECAVFSAACSCFLAFCVIGRSATRPSRRSWPPTSMIEDLSKNSQSCSASRNSSNGLINQRTALYRVCTSSIMANPTTAIISV